MHLPCLSKVLCRLAGYSFITIASLSSLMARPSTATTCVELRAACSSSMTSRCRGPHGPAATLPAPSPSPPPGVQYSTRRQQREDASWRPCACVRACVAGRCSVGDMRAPGAHVGLSSAGRSAQQAAALGMHAYMQVWPMRWRCMAWLVHDGPWRQWHTAPQAAVWQSCMQPHRLPAQRAPPNFACPSTAQLVITDGQLIWGHGEVAQVQPS